MPRRLRAQRHHLDAAGLRESLEQQPQRLVRCPSGPERRRQHARSGAQNEDSAAQGINGRQNDETADDAGAVYLPTRTGSTWTQHAYVKGSNNQAFDEFGGSVGLSRDGRTMVVGARGEDSNARGANGNQADNSVDEAGAALAPVAGSR